MLSHIVVIGGGIGGLVAATRLAHAGHSVDLFEQGTQTGGKMGRVVVDGCTFDTGPTLITMPFVFERFFASVGERFSDHVTLQRVDPACQYRWEDGSILDLPFDAEAVPDAIERFSPQTRGSCQKISQQRARDLRTHEGRFHLLAVRWIQGILQTEESFVAAQAESTPIHIKAPRCTHVDVQRQAHHPTFRPVRNV
ncbi:MAG: NAD(P)-binding protein [Ignavibacteria bacterium]|nr:NAD(P)-binding protein [Ignavibacteria bacterium]